MGCGLKRKLETYITMLVTKISKTFVRTLSKFVPEHRPVDKENKDYFRKFLENYDKILVLTGAGVSTESGIPDYRSENVGMYSKNYKPILSMEFVKNRNARVRYWARNYVGWPKFSSFAPNKTHFFLSTLQTFPNKILGIITQNVDALHAKAGSKNVLELHGNAFWVHCLSCNALTSRSQFQEVLANLNPDWTLTSDDIRPDGDVEISPEKAQEFNIPDCEHCSGILKPTVVFFGDNVPPKRVQKVEKLVDECEAMLVLGTSLSTLSSYRIITQAYDLNKFICIINIGKTRGDKFADLLIDGKCSDVIPIITDSVGSLK